MRPLALLVPFFLVVAAPLMHPVTVLTLQDGHAERIVHLREGSEYTYSYVNSIYLAPVVERHRVVDGRLIIQDVRSTDIRAVEYFRWDGEIRAVGDGFEQTAPSWSTPHLAIRISPAYRQRIEGIETVDLAEVFGDGVVDVAPRQFPWLLSR